MTDGHAAWKKMRSKRQAMEVELRFIEPAVVALISVSRSTRRRNGLSGRPSNRFRVVAVTGANPQRISSFWASIERRASYLNSAE